MTIPTKAAIGALTLGSFGIASYVASPYFKKPENKPQIIKPTISELIDNKYEYIPLSTKAGTENKDKTYWDTIWEEYKTKSNNVFQLTNWNTKERNPLTEELKVKCSSLLDSNINDDKDPNYENYTKYCARGVTIADEAKKFSWDVLDVQDTGEKDGDIWKKREDAKVDLDADLKLLGIDTTGTITGKIKTGCKDITKKKKQEDNYSKILDAYKKVCTKQSTDTEQD